MHGAALHCRAANPNGGHVVGKLFISRHLKRTGILMFSIRQLSPFGCCGWEASRRKLPWKTVRFGREPSNACCWA
jgi:hypothetical protein